SPGLWGSRRFVSGSPASLLCFSHNSPFPVIIVSCYSLAHAVQPEIYPPCSLQLSGSPNLLRHHLLLQPETLLRRYFSWPRGIRPPNFSLKASLFPAPRLLSNARSSSFPRRRRLSSIPSPSFHHCLQTTHRLCAQKSRCRSALANKILRPHSACRR